MRSRAGRRLVAAARLHRFERRITAAVDVVLSDARTRTIAAVRQPPLVVAAVAPVPPPSPFDPAWWRQSVARHLQPVADDIYDEIAADVLAGLNWTGTGLAGVDMTARVARLVGYVEGVGPDLAERLAQTLNHGVALGESVDALSDRVAEEFDVGGRQARTIARTEVVGASNGTAHDVAGALHLSGVNMTKTWLSTDDERTRDSHVDADGQTVAYDQPFSVGDAELMFPGDPDGPPEEVVNCRCTQTYEPADDGSLDSGDGTDMPDDGEAA